MNIRDKEGAGNEKKLEGKPIFNIKYSKYADDDQPSSFSAKKYPVIILSALTTTAIF
jgi:hypothetical protein